jgi:hypothetical protein
VSNFSVTGVATPALEAVLDRILELYPDIPALGSPFNTGNETFGLNSQFKRYAAICETTPLYSTATISIDKFPK